MELMYKNIEQIRAIKKRVESLDPALFNHVIIDNKPITPNTITIVMTASNRSTQTYFTLNTIKHGGWEDIHVVIVDDSTHDPIEISKLQELPFYIDLVQINRNNKCWHNPVVNYNLGFQFIKGKYLIIQNAEVAHVGEICADVAKNITDSTYFVYDVAASNGFNSNNAIYNMDLKYSNTAHQSNLYSIWYQARGHRCFNLHFLTAITVDTFRELVKGFSYDYSFGADYDDNDFILKIIAANITISNRFHDIHFMHGIHLYHNMSFNTWNVNVPYNDIIYNQKKQEYDINNRYLDLIAHVD
jgi:hypothetical protein